MTTIFISYSRADSLFIEQLVPLLEEIFPAYEIWYDKHITGGDDWWKTILAKISECSVFIYLLSNDSLVSEYCQAEFQEALRLQKPCLPVVVRAKTEVARTFPDLANEIRRRQWVDMTGGFKDATANARLYSAIFQKIGTAPTQADVPLYPDPVIQPQVTKTTVSARSKPDPAIIAAIIGAIAVIAAALIAIAPQILPHPESALGTVTETPQATIIAVQVTPTSNPIAAINALPTNTPFNLDTDVAQTKSGWATQTANAIASFTATPTSTFTSTVDIPATLAALFSVTSDRATATANAGLTQTMNVGQALTANAMFTVTAKAHLTQIANANSASTATANAQLTQTANAGQTATANVIASFTATPTLPVTTLIPSGAAVTPTIYATKMVQGVSLVWVPPGCFLMGSTARQIEEASTQYPNNAAHYQAEGPQHPVCITQGYWIAQFDITNAQFDAFVKKDGYSNDTYWSLLGQIWKQKKDITGPSNIDDGGHNCTPYSSDPAQPRLCVNFYEAEAYAKWLGCQLPTEAQWEYAARGPDSLIYPWGNTFDSTKANTSESGPGKTTAAGTYPGGASWVGALDMAGNVTQWVSDWHGTYTAQAENDPTGPSSGTSHVQRGGSWFEDSDLARAASRVGFPDDFRYITFGFRVVCGVRPSSP